MTVITTTLNDFTATLSRAWIWGRRILWTAAAVFALVLVLEAVHLHQLLGHVHPAVAWTVTLALAAALLYLGAVAVLRYLRVPRVIAPPELPALELGWTAEQQRAYREFAVRYLRRQSRNPHLDASARVAISAAVESIGSWSPPAEAATPVAETRALSRHVDRQLDHVLAPLDEIARRLIRRTAVEVSIATAVSPSILLDSLITLSRNVNMISRLADLYYGRPGLLGTARIVRDVIGSAVAAGALEVVTDNLASAASEVTGSWSSRLLGPLGQGAVNGVVTMRIGAAARVRCRALASRRVPWRPWRIQDYRRGFARLMDWLSEDVGPRFTTPLARWLAWGAGGDEEDLGPRDPETPAAVPRSRRDRSWWHRMGRRGAPGDATPEPAAAPPVREAGDAGEPGRDPLLDSDLFR